MKEYLQYVARMSPALYWGSRVLTIALTSFLILFTFEDLFALGTQKILNDVVSWVFVVLPLTALGVVLSRRGTSSVLDALYALFVFIVLLYTLPHVFSILFGCVGLSGSASSCFVLGLFIVMTFGFLYQFAPFILIVLISALVLLEIYTKNEILSSVATWRTSISVFVYWGAIAAALISILFSGILGIQTFLANGPFKDARDQVGFDRTLIPVPEHPETYVTVEYSKGVYGDDVWGGEVEVDGVRWSITAWPGKAGYIADAERGVEALGAQVSFTLGDDGERSWHVIPYTVRKGIYAGESHSYFGLFSRDDSGEYMFHDAIQGEGSVVLSADGTFRVKYVSPKKGVLRVKSGEYLYPELPDGALAFVIYARDGERFVERERTVVDYVALVRGTALESYTWLNDRRWPVHEGDQFIDGKGGVDTVTFPGQLSSYYVVPGNPQPGQENPVMVLRKEWPPELDVVVNSEFLQFSDQKIPVPTR